MRLLTRKSDDDFELVTFTDELPPYAILSHTWTDGEVTYDELVAGIGKHKPGYEKIRFCGERAAADNLQFFWVDTCCIDKSSSAELTEAINSMFKWYKQAKVCYVKLSDLNVDNIIADSIASSIANCRWFTRGWCLQELLAPSEVLFYNQNNRFIGSKRTLRRSISMITRICEEVLEDASCLYAVPVARRMSWASGRKTTRVEDVAYSLLGIFDVHMPMLYGEGEHAFIRLQEEIIKRSNDLSIFAWRADGEKNAYQDMFASSPIYFHRCNDISDNEEATLQLRNPTFASCILMFG
ncbi:heterokaryon incompatibility protein-domain-containing protein [Phaeosphaeriaceae sp. PMI808]|nr:heterokaryon incompatibility protein-domain-containing protein [Phaeosphaeriaceae sp. PMI808]